MGPAIAMLHASTHAGKHCEKVQHASARRTRTVFNHVWNASSNYVGTAKPGVAQSKGEFASGSPTDEDWWFRFNKGMRLRMGETRVQDEPLTSGMVVGLGRMCDAEYRRPGITKEEREALEELMCYVLLGFGAGLRGEEVPLVSLEGLVHFWHETEEEDDPYIMVTLRGRFKGETGLRWHCLPISDRTASGIRHRKWVGKLVRWRVWIQGEEGEASGCYYATVRERRCV